GGALYHLFFVQPMLESLGPEHRRSVGELMAARWRPWLFTAVVVLFVSGLMNFLMFKVPHYRDHSSAGLYHGLIGAKIILALGVMHVMTMLSLPGDKFDKKYRERAGFWLSLAVAMLVGIIVLGAIANNFALLFPGDAGT
ncbi:MAG: hypothetical protein IID33_02715, partial [Planctomycetes bacterium]|nr:hypothetical protein [Planctomycetota bacterium]